jgi:endonuclease/exonuclease/phosphatase family metal-dependent hydrolase
MLRTMITRFRWPLFLLGAVLLIVFGAWLLNLLRSGSRQVQVVTVTPEQSLERPKRTVDTLRILAWNIAHGRGNTDENWNGETLAERTERLKAIAEVIFQSRADIVILNEVDFDSTWSHGVDQARTLALAADYPHVAEQRNVDLRLPGFSWKFGNAVLSRYPLGHAVPLHYPAYSAFEAAVAGKKNGMVVTAATPWGTLDLIPIHLSHRSTTTRIESIKVIREHLGYGIPTILAGDFNCSRSPDPDPLRLTAIDRLLQEGTWTSRPHPPYGSGEYTYPTGAERERIDWIAVPANWTVVRSEVIPSTLSDHRPVFMEVRPTRSAD